ncbi:uncharacterized protein [Onthophagus taurus]|uniref:uncharacterized protein n=1 Tax=Onthophagus taurus TaxID=166361 RepID=UPI0039BE6CB0
MVHLTETERIEILIMVGYGDRKRTQLEVYEIFNERYPHREPITQSVVSKTSKRFRETSNVKDLPKTGPQRSATDEDKKIDILIEIEENPNISTRQLCLNHALSKGSIHKILHAENLHPYKPTLLQELSEDDYGRRVEFCEFMMERINSNPNFLNNMVFSDEATFCLNGNVNKQNSRYWAAKNPKLDDSKSYSNTTEIKRTLTGHRYLQLLQQQIIPACQENLDDLWFQQDGAPPHYHLDVRRYLDTVFPARWIGRRGSVEWPPRSPDLTPCDFFFWEYLKSKVYVNRPQNLT